MKRRAAEEPTKPLGPNYWKLWFASAISNFGDGLSVVAYPWLASALTRNPIAIAGVAVASGLPWLVFTLPAGVITDRFDRRRIVLAMDIARFALTAAVALAVLGGESSLNDPADVADGLAMVPDNAALTVALLYLAAFMLGSAEVLRDNTAQTLMPSIVDRHRLEDANGKLFGAEIVMNSFVGPPAAGFLLAVSFSLPLFIDAGSFAVAAGLMFLMAGNFKPKGQTRRAKTSFRTDISEGFGWLWKHPMLRSMAIALGIINGLGSLTLATHVLFAQEVLGLSAAGFGALGIAGAIGGVAGSLTASRVTERLGTGASLFATVLVSAITAGLIGLLPSVPLVFAMFAAISYVGVMWNVITVALRQSLIPDRLLGRVNSVYRFFGWGMIPIGTLLGGILVQVVDSFATRDTALRVPFLVSAVSYLLLMIYVVPRLNSTVIDEAKAVGIPAKEADDAKHD